MLADKSGDGQRGGSADALLTFSQIVAATRRGQGG